MIFDSVEYDLRGNGEKIFKFFLGDEKVAEETKNDSDLVHDSRFGRRDEIRVIERKNWKLISKLLDMRRK